jgi:hypothetical protein
LTRAASIVVTIGFHREHAQATLFSHIRSPTNIAATTKTNTFTMVLTSLSTATSTANRYLNLTNLSKTKMPSPPGSTKSPETRGLCCHDIPGQHLTGDARARN